MTEFVCGQFECNCILTVRSHFKNDHRSSSGLELKWFAKCDQVVTVRALFMCEQHCWIDLMVRCKWNIFSFRFLVEKKKTLESNRFKWVKSYRQTQFMQYQWLNLYIKSVCVWVYSANKNIVDFWEKVSNVVFAHAKCSRFWQFILHRTSFSIVTLNGKKERTCLYIQTHTENVFTWSAIVMALGASEQKSQT